MTIVCSRCGGNHMRSECPTLGVIPAQSKPSGETLAHEIAITKSEAGYFYARYLNELVAGGSSIEKLYETLAWSLFKRSGFELPKPPPSFPPQESARRAVENAIMKYPYFTQREAEKIADAAMEALRNGTS
jgi:hypothetical protein